MYMYNVHVDVIKTFMQTGEITHACECDTIAIHIRYSYNTTV